MPIHCPIALQRITDDEMRSIDYAVMSHVFATHNELGRLADEVVYQEKLVQLLQAAGIEATTEVPIKLSFRDFSTPLAMDLVVEGKVIYELKAASELLPIHKGQLLSYLFLTNATHGKLVNFKTPTVQSEFLNANLTNEERRQFEVDLTEHCGECGLVDSIRELIADWGTGLNASLYRRALLQCQGDETELEQLLPMTSAGHQIGRQRFHLLSTDTALEFTTFKRPAKDSFTALKKLLAASPLKRIQWVNITHGKVTLTTITRD